MTKGQITAWELYNIATEIYKPGKTDFPALIPQNGAMAELLLSHLPEAAEVQDAVPVSRHTSRTNGLIPTIRIRENLTVENN